MESPNPISQLTSLIARYGLKGLVSLARVYLGPAAPREAAPAGREVLATNGSAGGLTAAELRTLALAGAKLAFETGELGLYNPNVAGDGAMPSWQLDENGAPPALSLAHLIAAPRLWDSRATASAVSNAVVTASRPTARAVRVAARNSYFAGSSRAVTANLGLATRTPEVTRMATTNTISSHRGGCGCGGVKTAPPSPAIADPCAGGMQTAPPSREPGCFCGGACGGRGCSCAKPTYTYDRDCPTIGISCETKEHLRECVKVALCDFARCVTDTLCPDGRFDAARLENRDVSRELTNCVGQLVCSFLHCVPEALCPEPREACTPPATDCLPCGYAVEVSR